MDLIKPKQARYCRSVTAVPFLSAMAWREHGNSGRSWTQILHSRSSVSAFTFAGSDCLWARSRFATV